MADNVHEPTMKLGICIALGGPVWICFGESARFDWVRYDDGDYVYRSGRVTSGLNLQSVIWSFTNFHAHNWHPITTLSHMLDCQLFGVTPGAAHVVNVILHALAVQSLALNPNDGNAQSNLAWMLATTPDDSLRDGTRAVTLAESALQLAGGVSPILHRTLAAAYAETGRFADAIETATRGRRLAERESNRSLADEFAANISRYQQHLPLRDISLQLVDE